MKNILKPRIQFFNKIWISYINFLFKLIIKKKNTFIIPIIIFSINIIFIILISDTVNSSNDLTVFIYSLTFLQLLFTIIFSSIKSLNIFNDLEQEGIEIIVFSKKITKNTIIKSKILFFVLINLIWSLILFLSNLMLFLFNIDKFELINNYLLFSFLSIFSCGIIFGLITGLISLKWSFKVAITIPLLTFMPLVLAGSFINYYSSSTAEQMARYLNIQYDKYDSGTIADVEKTFLNNQNDKFYIYPKNINNHFLSKNQEQFIEEAYAISKNSATALQNYSWLSLPYQFLNILNKNDRDILDFLNKNNNSELSQYLFNKNISSKEFNYLLNKNPQIVSLKNINNEIEQNMYIVPGIFKVQSKFLNLANREIIYARENADSFKVRFIEDSYTFASPDNLVGKLKANIIKEALSSTIFQNKAKSFFEKLNFNITKAELLSQISSLVNENNNDNFLNLIDEQTILFKSNLDTENIKNITEKKVYIATAIIYYLYFTYNDSTLLKTLLKNDNEKLAYNSSSIAITINNYNYLIGGYESFIPVQQVDVDKIIFRYELTKSNNYLFQPVREVYSIEADQKIIQKEYFILIWFIVIFSLLGATYYSYKRKDYK